jgi:hypothetical protein
MTLASTGTAVYESKCVQTVLIIYSVVSAIASITTASIAYTRLSSATFEYRNLLRNWEKPPITAFAVSSSPCPDGYATLDLPKWPGTVSSACACPSGAAYVQADGLSVSQFSSTTGSCNGNQTLAGCISQPILDAQKDMKWRGSNLCFQRGKEAQLVTPTTQRPIPTSPGKCVKGYKACGTGTYTKERSICVKESDVCPVTGLDVSSTTPEGYDASSAAATGDGMSWFSRVSFSGEMPINELIVAFDKSGGKRGDCYGENAASQEKYSGPGSSAAYLNEYPSACKKTDNRWNQVDVQEESKYLKDNFDVSQVCTASTQKADFIGSGTQCIDITPYVIVTNATNTTNRTTTIVSTSGTPFTNPNCMVSSYNSETFGGGSGVCGGSDTICRDIVFQSSCGALGRWASEATTFEWTILARHESYWKPDCDASMIDLKRVEGRAETIKGTLLANLIICAIANFFLGILFPMWIYNAKFGKPICCVGLCSCCNCTELAKGAMSQKNGSVFTQANPIRAKFLESRKKTLDVVFIFAKLIPASIALGILGSVMRVFSRAAAGDCTDEKLTETTVKDIDKSLSSSFDSLISQVVIDGLSVVAAIAMAAYDWRSKRQAAAKGDDPEGGGVHMADVGGSPPTEPSGSGIPPPGIVQGVVVLGTPVTNDAPKPMVVNGRSI